MQKKIYLITLITNKLELLNPQSLLQRGYALAIDKNKKVIYSPDQVEVDDIFQLRIGLGQLSAKVLDKGSKNG